jgi:ribonuclease HI
MHWMSWERLTEPKIAGGMGFRDLPMLNRALLGKQAWRLAVRPNSLCAQVLKGRYYHDSDFLSATRKKHASQTWRAILAGREVLKLGLIKRIGNGETTKIWEDRWISNHFGGKPLTLPDAQQANLVSDLLTASGQWNVELVRQIFYPVDAEAIIKIPLRNSVEDFLAWEPEKHGQYSVKTAYRLLFTGRQQQATETQAGSSGDDSWRLLWKVEVPPKVRVFWWRVLHEFLPAKQILHKGHIERIPRCDTCGAPEETIRHVLLECTVAKLFWNITRDVTGVKIPNLHEDTWAHDLLHGRVCSKKNAAVILCGMWLIWMQRNKRHHGEDHLPINKAVEWVRDTATDLWQIMHSTEKKHGKKPAHWKLPIPGWIKCNVDGAFYTQDSTGAVGVVLRDDTGQFLQCKAEWRAHVPDAMTMEALVLKEGLTLARQMGSRKVCVETDCSEVVNLWKQFNTQRSAISAILGDIKEISRSFDEFDLMYASRTCNRVAHECAKRVSREHSVEEWHVISPALMDLLAQDCNQNLI